MDKTLLMRKEDAYQLNTYKKFPLVLVKGKGMYVSDADGTRYLDFYGGHAVALTGHCHPKVIAALKKQLDKLLFYSNVAYSDIRAEAAEALISAAPGFGKVFFCNSGAEANEAAMRVAKKFTGKKGIIAMKGGFHGRTTGALSATGIGKYRTGELLSSVSFAEFGSIESVKSLLAPDTAAIILEPIQSMAGVNAAGKGYYKGLRELCDSKGIMLIFDEVQTGFGRTGKMFAAQAFGVAPDIITLAKGIASGVPMGAVLLREKVAKTITYGELGSTFGGSPLACAGLKATIEVIADEKLVENAYAMGMYIKKTFSGMKGLVRVRGEGLLLGLEFGHDVSGIAAALLKENIIVSTSEAKNVLRLLPPLIIGKTHVDTLHRAMEKVLQDGH